MLNLQKGEGMLLDLAKSDIKTIWVGLGWDTRCDLDVHAILRDETGKSLDTVYYGKQNALGVSLSGDNTTGDGDGDDEIIYLELNKINKKVKYVSIYVNVYSSGKTFKDVKGSYVRLYDPITERTHARANLEDKSLDKFRTVHFADIEINHLMEFKVVMEGGASVNGLNNKYTRSNVDSIMPKLGVNHTVYPDGVKEETVKKKKRFFGLF